MRSLRGEPCIDKLYMMDSRPVTSRTQGVRMPTTIALIGSLLALGASLVWGFNLRSKLHHTRDQLQWLEMKSRARQSNGGMMRRASGPRAEVERARTNVRNTNDIPRTGRTGRIAILKGGDGGD